MTLHYLGRIRYFGYHTANNHCLMLMRSHLEHNRLLRVYNLVLNRLAPQLKSIGIPALKSSAGILNRTLTPNSVKAVNVVRRFHGSVYASAKKEKVKGGDIKLPDTKDMEAQMEKKFARLVEELLKLRSGQANTEIFRAVMVTSGGTKVSVADSGQLSVKSPTKMSISVFDPSLVSAISEAIRDCGMGLAPSVEGNNIVMSIPKPSKESKEALVKTARIIADKSKQDMRQVRKDGMDILKKLKGAILDDEIKRYTKDIDTMVDKKIEKITKTLKDKEVDLMK